MLASTTTVETLTTTQESGGTQRTRKKRWEDCPVPKFGAGGRPTSRRGRSILAASGSGETFGEEEGDSNNDNEESELDGPINIESAVTSDKCLSHSDNDYLSDF